MLEKDNPIFFMDSAEMGQLARSKTVEYANNRPFPHIVLDNFLPETVLDEVLNYFPAPEYKEWNQNGTVYQKKLDSLKVERLPASLRNIIYQFNTAPMLEFLEELSGIKGLVSDPYYMGGGLHQILPGGMLEIHADFNLNPQIKLERRLNVLIYLNKDWKEEYNGQLELWDANMEKCEVKVAPLFNRCVIFTLGEKTFHGHPVPLACPPDMTRKSIALYYYTRPQTEPELPYRDTAWQERPEQPYLGAEFYRLENEARVMREQFLEEHHRRLQLENGELAALREAQAADLAEKTALRSELKAVQSWALDLERRLQQSNKKSALRQLISRLRKVN